MKTRFVTTRLFLLATLLVLSSGGSRLHAQAPAQAPPPATPEIKSKPAMQAGKTSPDGREARLAGYLTGATFTGMFTIDGGSTAPKPESYTIVSCETLEAENEYRLKVKIRYGDVDGEFPMDLKILWSGSTPVITLDGVWIPGLGTFSSRVLIHDGRYAGTWQHDAKGGHLYGTITPAEAE